MPANITHIASCILHLASKSFGKGCSRLESSTNIDQGSVVWRTLVGDGYQSQAIVKKETRVNMARIYKESGFARPRVGVRERERDKSIEVFFLSFEAAVGTLYGVQRTSHSVTPHPMMPSSTHKGKVPATWLASLAAFFFFFDLSLSLFEQTTLRYFFTSLFFHSPSCAYFCKSVPNGGNSRGYDLPNARPACYDERRNEPKKWGGKSFYS